jgi:predicted amidohydrolase YtcJ
VKALTWGGSQCLGFGWEDKLGTIEEGKLADFVVLQRNLFEIPANEIAGVLVERTVMGGNIVYDRPRQGDVKFIDEESHTPTSRYIED